jgi:hypothetical protein
MNNSRNERREQVREIPSKNPQLGDNVSVSRSNSGPALVNLEGSVLKLQYKTRVKVYREENNMRKPKSYTTFEWIAQSIQRREQYEIMTLKTLSNVNDKLNQ